MYTADPFNWCVDGMMNRLALKNPPLKPFNERRLNNMLPRSQMGETKGAGVLRDLCCGFDRDVLIEGPQAQNHSGTLTPDRCMRALPQKR